MPHLEHVVGKDVSKAGVSGLQVVESLPHIAVGGEDDGLQATVVVAQLHAASVAVLTEVRQEIDRGAFVPFRTRRSGALVSALVRL